MLYIHVGSRSNSPKTEVECDRQPHCDCNFRRHSWDEVLDKDGQALLAILEFPSKVWNSPPFFNMYM